jgi:hypothetical protein
MGSHLDLRQMMAENGYEVTPEEAKVLCDNFSEAIEHLTSYESYMQFKNMDKDDMVKYLSFYNKHVGKKDRMTMAEFKEFRNFIIDLCEGN